MQPLRATALSLVLTAIAAAPLSAQIAATIPFGELTATLQPIATGLVAPIAVVDAKDGSGRLFVVDQAGDIRLISGGVLQPGAFLNLQSTIVGLNGGYDERGLLGLAFSPNFANASSPQFGTFYTYTSEPARGTPTFALPSGSPVDHHDVVTEWKVSAANPNTVDLASRREVLRIEHPQSNHNGGTLAFGPDNLLYISNGDGGSSNDVGGGHTPGTGNAQNTSSILGKILRIDPTQNTSPNGQYGVPSTNPFASGGGLGEVYAYGFRNVYRFSFDRQNGDLLAGDVGQNSIEEVNKVVLGGNYGWNVKEGSFPFNSSNGSVGSNSPGTPVGLIDPVLQYDHDEGQAVIGGFVYRGSLFPQLVGKYVFGELLDNGSGRFFYADLATGQIKEFNIGAPGQHLGFILKGMGEDANGELYLTGSTLIGPSGTTGAVYRLATIVPEPATWALMLIGSSAFAWSAMRRRRRSPRLSAEAE